MNEVFEENAIISVFTQHLNWVKQLDNSYEPLSVVSVTNLKSMISTVVLDTFTSIKAAIELLNKNGKSSAKTIQNWTKYLPSSVPLQLSAFIMKSKQQNTLEANARTYRSHQR